MNFGWAQEAMERGERVKREAWDSFAATHPQEYASMELSVPAPGFTAVYVVTRHDGTKTTFNPSHLALLARDWVPA